MDWKLELLLVIIFLILVVYIAKQMQEKLLEECSIEGTCKETINMAEPADIGKSLEILLVLGTLLWLALAKPDWKFIIKHALILLPICLVLVFFMHTASFWSADWVRHVGIMKLTDYPPLAPALAQFAVSLNLHGIMAVLLFAIIPYILIREITESEAMPIIYLYATGIPIVMMFGGFIAEAITQILMMSLILLLKKSYKQTTFLFITFVIFFIAFNTHRFAFPALFVAGLFAVWKWDLW